MIQHQLLPYAFVLFTVYYCFPNKNNTNKTTTIQMINVNRQTKNEYLKHIRVLGRTPRSNHKRKYLWFFFFFNYLLY